MMPPSQACDWGAFKADFLRRHGDVSQEEGRCGEVSYASLREPSKPCEPRPSSTFLTQSRRLRPETDIDESLEKRMAMVYKKPKVLPFYKTGRLKLIEERVERRLAELRDKKSEAYADFLKRLEEIYRQRRVQRPVVSKMKTRSNRVESNGLRFGEEMKLKRKEKEEKLRLLF